MSRRRRIAVWVLGFSIATAAVPAEPPGAFELLERVRRAYASLDSYHDLGEIERTTSTDGGKEMSLFFFETAVDADGRFLWRTHGETAGGFEERVVWNEGDDAFVYSSLLRQFKPIASIPAELAHGFGRGGYEALIVPLLMAGATEVLEDPEAAAVEGPEDCGDSTCWVVSLSRMGGAVESRLRVDSATSLIREVMVDLGGGATVVQAAAAAADPAGGSPGPGTGGRLQIRMAHHPGAGDEVAFTVPDGARRVTRWEVDTPTEAQEDPWLDVAFQEEITVSLFTVVARIVDRRGEPILGLTPADLSAQIGKQDFPVSSLDWSSSSRAPESPPAELAEARRMARSGSLSMDSAPEAPPGKLVVLFLQVDLEPTRIKGHLKILPDVDRLLRSLHPDDSVAIVSFDSHLKLWQDFSRDRDATFETLKQAVGYGSPVARRGRGPSLAESFDFRAAKAAASPEKALLVTAEGMIPLAGEKDLIYLGWGLGRFGRGGVTMTADYGPAVRALDAANATVFVLDVTQADGHSLEVGLQSVANHTGGTYSRTFHFSSQAVRRLARTLTGHYLVTIDRSAQPQARGRLQIRLKQKQGRVLFKPTILG